MTAAASIFVLQLLTDRVTMFVKFLQQRGSILRQRLLLYLFINEGCFSIAISMSLRVSVGKHISGRNYSSSLHQMFCTCYLWLGPPVVALRYIMYFRFYG